MTPKKTNIVGYLLFEAQFSIVDKNMTIAPEVLKIEDLLSTEKIQDARQIIESLSQEIRNQSLDRLLQLEITVKEQAFNDSFAIIQELEDHKWPEPYYHASFLVLKGYTYFKLSKYEFLEDIFDAIEQYLASYEGDKDVYWQRKEALYLSNKAQFHYRNGNYTDALNYLIEHVKLKKAFGTNIEIANAQNNLATIYKHFGKEEEALEIFNNNIQLYRTAGREKGVATTLHNIALVLADMGKLRSALIKAKECEAIYKQLNSPEIISTYTLIGSIYHMIGNIELSIHYYSLILQSIPTEDEPFVIANTKLNLGDVFFDKFEFTNAIIELKESINISNQYGFLEIKAHGLVDLLDIYLHQGDMTSASDILDEIISFSKPIHDDWSEYVSKWAQANYYSYQGRFEYKAKAIKLFREILNYNYLNHFAVLDVALKFASLLLDEYNLSNDDFVLQELEYVLEYLNRVTEEHKDSPTIVKMYIIKSRIALFRKDLHQSLEMIQIATDIAKDEGLFKLILWSSKIQDSLFSIIEDYELDIENNSPNSNMVTYSEIDELFSYISHHQNIPIEINTERPILFFMAKTLDDILVTHVVNNDILNPSQFIDNYLSIQAALKKENKSRDERLIEQTKIGKYRLLTLGIKDITVTYVYEGQTYGARYRLESLVENLLSIQEIWTSANAGDFSQKQIELIQYTINETLGNPLSDLQIPNDQKFGEVDSLIPIQFDHDLMNFKSIIHPIKLFILKLLHDSNQMPRNEMLKILDIKSGTFGSHIDRLVDEELVIVEDYFVENKFQKVISITSRGLKTYSELKLEIQKLFN